jgi:2-oxoglutarate dehydrogenase E2 component (dihydrolipoamide succinyltransferase)
MPSLEVKIPPMGESIASGIIAKWHVRDGDLVQKEQPLFELETDKITSEGTAETAGRISLKVAAGDEVKIGQVVATIDPEVRNQTSEVGAKPPGSSPTSDIRPLTAAPSPAVRRLAAETGIDPATITGTGKAGRVTKSDLLAAAEAKPAAPPPPEIPTIKSQVPPAAPGRQTRRKMSPLRAKLAQRLVAAQHQAAMLTTFNEVDMSAVVALRAKYQDDFVKKHGLKLGFMSFFAKAVVHALREVPAVNAVLEGETIVENHFYDLGIAVSTDKGLMVPVIRSCDALSLAEIEKAIADIAQRARDGKVTLADLEGGVFTITNGGIFGSMLSTPILNPPQSAILGLHAITERPVAVNGQVVIRPMMYLALSYDHRLVDGREAVTFLVKIKQVIEDPARFMLGV